MTIIREGRYPGEFIKSEGADGISRDVVTLARHSEIYQSGTVLGRLDVSRKFTHLDPAADDGSQTAVAVLYQDRDATAADVKGVVIARVAQVKDARLVWPDGITDTQKKEAIDDLDARAIVVRS
ncbi:head decoration protein [Azospirillum picis]|uniref:Head decoration protein n=1 Tax=Azospirillum picis TaxID=488438 RepID=A0ABU0MUZ0_9PROT|nr:head decoration protein [Azospirillum picis]MBP2303321.1 hypothetical protein [Azospirillum picis]MDQ0537139.1 hypothetical protein [Azospirillum picis]